MCILYNTLFSFNTSHVLPQIGSFQVFVNGFKDADCWIRRFQEDPLPPEVQKHFQHLFEKLVCLDYIIRNTGENWNPLCQVNYGPWNFLTFALLHTSSFGKTMIS